MVRSLLFWNVGLVDHMCRVISEFRMFNKILDFQLDLLIAETLNDNLNVAVVVLLNKILDELEYDRINTINEFKICRPDLLKINGVQFLADNELYIAMMGIDKKRDMNYNSRNSIKSYIINVLNGILKVINCRVQIFISSIVVNKKSKSINKYRIVKLDDEE